MLRINGIGITECLGDIKVLLGQRDNIGTYVDNNEITLGYTWTAL